MNLVTVINEPSGAPSGRFLWGTPRCATGKSRAPSPAVSRYALTAGSASMSLWLKGTGSMTGFGVIPNGTVNAEPAAVAAGDDAMDINPPRRGGGWIPRGFDAWLMGRVNNNAIPSANGECPPISACITTSFSAPSTGGRSSRRPGDRDCTRTLVAPSEKQAGWRNALAEPRIMFTS